jgi:hypothetical protein
MGAVMDKTNDTDMVLVRWNEFVTYQAVVPRSVMWGARALKEGKHPWQHDIVVFDAAADKGEIVDSDGMQNITFHRLDDEKEI